MWEQVKQAMVESAREVCGSVVVTKQLSSGGTLQSYVSLKIILMSNKMKG